MNVNYQSLRYIIVWLLGLCITSSAVSQDKEELEALFWARKDSALTRYSQADVDFMTGMIAHHAQALIMSSYAEPNGASPMIQTLAARIINAQNDEIQIMQQWLEMREQPVPHLMIEDNNLMIHGAQHHHMPGMLSAQQLKELEHAQGDDFDQLFLKYMIMHHEGAVYMVHQLFNTDGAITGEDTYRLASDIQVDQVTEIDRMKLMLDELENSN
ncbi:MAG: DUF305 domain-containing protein [Bacteroidetes bacterium]|nr:DUF305 domain-containing protein [Bacteroidota bacterium]MCY4232533.1 DUF305 domain-containing protein [Bacteroidota bacterium]